MSPDSPPVLVKAGRRLEAVARSPDQEAGGFALCTICAACVGFLLRPERQGGEGQGPTHPPRHRVSPYGSFTQPEYAQVGLIEAKARETHDVVTTVMPLDSA